MMIIACIPSLETDIQSWDLLITKLNNQGETLWSRTYGSNGSDRGASIIQKQDSSGYILCGYVSETSEDVSSGYGGIDIWVIEINNNGELINEVTFGGSQNDRPIQIINSSNGYAIIADTDSNDGDGKANTLLIIEANNNLNNAAKVCNDFVYNGYSDWYLPSIGELELMCQNLYSEGIGNFADSFYWSSTDTNKIHNAHWIQFSSSPSNCVVRTDMGRNMENLVRPIRQF